MNKQQQYTVDIVQVSKPQQKVASDCNEIMFINKGAVTCFIDNFPLAQNEFITFGGNRDEICVKTFSITNNTSLQLYAVKKFYVNL